MSTARDRRRKTRGKSTSDQLGAPKKRHKNRYRAPRTPFDLPTALLTMGGLGFLRPAPGTWGSIPPAALAFLLLALGVPALWLTLIMGAVILITGFWCVYWGAYAFERFGRRKDAAEVVADETAGCALVFMFLPAAAVSDASVLGAVGGTDAVSSFILAAVLAAFGFVSFRVFDIVKLPPARRLEALPLGWGVLLDDLAAGAFALASMQVLTRFIL